jgi:cysteine desulfurase/selenocysteine lyase
MTFSSTTVRQDFPFLGARTGGVQPYVYLDSAATSQKPQQVLDAMNRFYASANAGVHRSVHKLSERATVAYEGARAAVQHFLHARHPEEIVFTKNATEAINLVAHAWARTNIQPGSAIALSLLEHHSNIVPWLQLAEEKDISIEWVDLEKDGTL